MKFIDWANKFWYDHFDFDRAGERKIKKSMELWQKGGHINHLRAKIICNKLRKNYSCVFHPEVRVGKNFRMEHLMFCAIGATSIFGDNVKIFLGVSTIAKAGPEDQELIAKKARRHAKVGNNVVLGHGCTIMGPITIGDNCIIGANATVTKDIPANSIVVGVNQIIERKS